MYRAARGPRTVSHSPGLNSSPTLPYRRGDVPSGGGLSVKRQRQETALKTKDPALQKKSSLETSHVPINQHLLKTPSSVTRHRPRSPPLNPFKAHPCHPSENTL